MSSDAEQALALVFRRFDADEPVPENELVKVMSLTLGWTKPSKAANLLSRGVEAGLLEATDEAYTPTFDPNAVEVPFGFSPSSEVFEPPAEGPDETGEAQPEPGTEPAQPEPAGVEERTDETNEVLDALLDAIAAEVEGGRKRAVAAVNAKQSDLGGLVTLDVAALLVAREHGIDVAETAGDVLERLRASA